MKRRIGVALLGLFVVVSSLASIPALAAGLDVEIAEIEAVDPASQPFELPPPPDPPTDEQRMPVLDLSDIEGIWPDEVVEVAPAPIDVASLEEALEGAKLLPEEGAASVDVYGVGPDDTSHIAVIYPEDVNKLQADGEWRDIKVGLTEEAKGWSWKVPSGASSFLPQELSMGSPVTFTVPGGELSLSATGGSSAGVVKDASVTYPNVFPQGADLRYTPTLSGLVEHIVLPRPPSSPTFTFDIATSGLTLAANEHGGIDIVDPAGEIVAVFPTPVAYDAAEEPLSATGVYALTATGEGTWQLAVTMDPAFLETATYPVEIDPTWDDIANRDGFTRQADPTNSFESDQFLQVDTGERSYARFQTNTIDAFDLVVYDASMYLFPQGSGGVPGGIDAKRVSEAWPTAGTLKWNNQPAVGNAYDTLAAANEGEWWRWQLKGLYQHYLDLGDQYTTHFDNEGVALTAANPKTFHSSNSTLAGSEPALYVVYNNPPEAPTLNTPNAGYVSESESVTLKVDGGASWPEDPDNDDVLVSFQISDNGTDWTGSNLVFESPYDDAWSFTVPAGVLIDGQQYFWRAVSRDVCNPATQGLCELKDGTNTVRQPKASGVRGFTMALERLGTDERWHMWSHDVGNNMDLQVNGSNGNVVLDVALDAYATPIGDLDIGLTYNSQQTQDYGMGQGWDLAIGPRGEHNSLPIELTKLDTGNDAGLKIRFRGGRTLYFPHQHGKRWGGTSALSGYVNQAWNDRYIYFASDGGMFTFDSGALNGAPILKAKPAQSSAEAAVSREFNYTYDASLQLTEVTDPLGRRIQMQWTSGKLTSIHAIDFGNQLFTLTYAASNLATIATTVDNPSDGAAPRQETVDFAYVASGTGAGLLSTVRDAHQTANAGNGWRIDYLADPNANIRASTITAPSTGSPTTPPTPWRFRYHSPYKGTTAAGVCITDPRGTDNPCDVDTTDPAFETQVEFTWGGYPFQLIGPHGPSDSFRRLSTYVFDNHNNLVCERSAEANASSQSCSSLVDANGQYNDLDDEGLSTTYDYLGEAPYRLSTVTRPAPNALSSQRMRESYTYDQGTGFIGLHAELYENADLQGLPDAERLWSDLGPNWGSGVPDGITPAGGWGARISGAIELSGVPNGTRTGFRVLSETGDRVRLSVEGQTIVDCVNTAGMANCDGSDADKVLWGADAPIEIEYTDFGGPASLSVQWNQSGTWTVIPAFRLTPKLGLVTHKTYSELSAGGSSDLWQERWTYSTADRMIRHLHDKHIREDLTPGGSAIYATAYDYDPTYGRVISETKEPGTPLAQTTTFDWLDGPAPSGWAIAGLNVSCLRTVTDHNGETVGHQCNVAGDTVKTTQTLSAEPGTQQTSQVRTTAYEFDSLGRPTRTEQVETGAREITIYDLAGRISQTKTLVAGTTEAITAYVYDHAGHLKTETLPSGATIQHEWNWVDLETKTIDERAKQWNTTYDHENRILTQTSPLGAVTTTTYQLGQGAPNRIVVDAPSGASTATDYDVLGRKIAETLESYDPTTYAYDVQGNLTSMTDPTDVRTDYTYSGFSEPVDTVRFAQSGSPATTSNSYDAAGRLSQVNGPLTADDDLITYSYDSLWRMNSVTYEGVTLPGSSTKSSVAIVYNDADERVKVTQPLTTSTTMTRNWTYDQAGRQATYNDAAGTTTTTYNKAGWVTQVADPRPMTVFFGYDTMGRRVCRFTAACTAATAGAESWAYDAAGNMTQAKNATITHNMTYDNDGRLNLVQRGTTTETTYTYAPTTGLLTSVADLAGTTAFTYNAAGQISTLDDPFAASTTKTTYGYEASTGRLLTRADAQADMTWSRLYEGATGRLDTQTIKKSSNATTLASFDLAYDPAGNVTQKASTVFANPSNTTWSYEYDGASRMTKAIGENAGGAATTWDYTYDGGGNRTRAKTTTGSVVSDLSTVYDTRGLPTTATDAATAETVAYTHDATGNLTLTNSSINTKDWSQTWDAYGRMTCAKQATTCTSGTTRVQFTHDAFDRARTRVNSGTTTTYTYTGISEQLARTVGSVTTDFASTASGAPMAQKVGSAVSYHLLDTHSDVVGLVSPAAANQGTTAYDAYGGVLGTTGTQGTLGFQGDITDPTTKQVDMGTRWYAPGQGRFTSRDSMFGEIDSPMTLNQFAYAAMNPVTMSDPTGMMPNCAFSCTPEQEQNLISNWSQAYGNTVQAGTGGSGYSPGTSAQASAQDPVQAITYVREAGDYAVPDGCFRRCGSVAGATIDWGTDPSPEGEGGVELTGMSDTCPFWLLCAFGDPNGPDRALGQIADKTVSWGLATAAKHIGRADSRQCGIATCYDNANFMIPPFANAWTLGTRVFCRDVCSPDTVTHEEVHVRDQQAQGLSYGPRYIYQAIVNGLGCDNPWERPAYGPDIC